VGDVLNVEYVLTVV